MDLSGSHHGSFVLASLLMAILASYTTVEMTGRLAMVRGAAARWWLAGGSLAAGLGLWTSHFVSTLTLPAGEHSHALRGALLSLLLAISFSSLVLWIASQRELPRVRLVVGAVLLGIPLCAMQDTGIPAPRTGLGGHGPLSFLLIAGPLAVLVAGGFLWLAFHLRQVSFRRTRLRIGAALILGASLWGMYSSGIGAVRLPPGGASRDVLTGVTLPWIALLILVATGALQSMVLMAAILERRFEIRTARLASRLANAKEELQFLSLHDNLTRLPNRALLADRLEQEIQMARREKSRFSVLFLDLDGFRRINEAYGHSTGDALLVAAAQRLRAALRTRDTLARMGGDEFVMLANTCEASDAASLADKLVVAMREPFNVGGYELRVTISIGIAMYCGKASELQDLLKNADAAMARAKELGRDGYCFFEESMSDDAQAQLQILQDLRLAQDRHEFLLHYQPEFEAGTEKVIGAEALLRWNHPTRGLVPPDQFIPLAEKTGLIFQIGWWVLDQACRQMSEWRDKGYGEWSVSVNLSAMQFNHPGLTDMVRDVLREHALEPRCLTLEITESTAMQDAGASLAILQQLDEMGVPISIDDFGTGYSSLLYLKRLPASELKIDRGFVRELASDTEDAAIIAAIVALGKTLNLKIVAEGVETREQQEFLTRLGCDSLQGYLLGRPMPAEQFLQAVAQRQAASQLAAV